MKASKALKHDTRWVFVKKGSCSRTFFYILNRDFGYPMEMEEMAIDPMAGGIMQQGYQCGMLWGASMAIGAEAYRRCGDCHKATALSIKATQNLIGSFIGRAKSEDCYDITSVDWTNKRETRRYMMSGKFYRCFRLADKWAPEAISAAKEGLSQDYSEVPERMTSCASEVVKKMGGSENEMALVAGFAGGLGLHGNACGALAAAIWMNSLKWCRENPGKSGYKNPGAQHILDAFLEATDYEFLCSKLTGQHFSSMEEHTEFITNGGCDKLINTLAHV